MADAGPAGCYCEAGGECAVKRVTGIRRAVAATALAVQAAHAQDPAGGLALASAGVQAAPALAAPFTVRRIPLFTHPKDIREDYVYPPVYTQQRLIWGDPDMEWRMRFPTRRYAYAGIALRQPLDLSLDRPRARLIFRFRPAHLAPFLSVALVDSGARELPVMTDYWLQDVGALTGDDWVTIEIALASFPAEGVAVGPIGSAVDEKPRVFDWAAVREIRFVSGGGRVPNQEIIVKQMRIQR